jgi:hypothetical protein
MEPLAWRTAIVSRNFITRQPSRQREWRCESKLTRQDGLGVDTLSDTRVGCYQLLDSRLTARGQPVHQHRL